MILLPGLLVQIIVILLVFWVFYFLFLFLDNSGISLVRDFMVQKDNVKESKTREGSTVNSLASVLQSVFIHTYIGTHIHL